MSRFELAWCRLQHFANVSRIVAPLTTLWYSYRIPVSLCHGRGFQSSHNHMSGGSSPIFFTFTTEVLDVSST
jgi:hypothetical protein